jgi:hypothetical protein
MGDRLAGKATIVTGAGSGIRRVSAVRIALDYAKQGIRCNALAPGT